MVSRSAGYAEAGATRGRPRPSSACSGGFYGVLTAPLPTRLDLGCFPPRDTADDEEARRGENQEEQGREHRRDRAVGDDPDDENGGGTDQDQRSDHLRRLSDGAVLLRSGFGHSGKGREVWARRRTILHLTRA